MMIPLGLAPQRSNVLPSFRVLSEEAKLQVPTSRADIESGGCVGSAPARDGIAAAALPMSFEVDPLIKGLYPTTGFHLMLPIESR
jgi:hypothetical protein